MAPNKKLTAAITKYVKVVSKQRDELRDLISEAEEYCNDADEAISLS